MAGMDEDTARTYLTGKFDQIQAAYADRNPAGANQVIDSIAGDGFPHAAAAIDDALASTPPNDPQTERP